MIQLDANVVSEPLRPQPYAAVIEWTDAQPLETMFLSAITVAELRLGVTLLTVATRFTGPFAAAGLTIIDPWQT
jgi:hypothetical protein